MTAANGKQLPVGLRSVTLFALTEAGYPAGNSHLTPYEGISFVAPKAFNLTVAQPRKITHTGADGVVGVDFLPPTEGVSGELRVADYRHDIHALVTGIAAGTVGEASEIAHATSKQGYEPVIGGVFYQQSLDLVSGLRRWRTIVIPKMICIPQPASFADSAQDVVYQIAPLVSTMRMWGDTLVLGTDGYSHAQFFEYMSEKPLKPIAFEGNGSATAFSFPTGAQAAAVAKVAVFRNGVAESAGVTVATDDVTFTTAPADGDNITIFYEVA